MKSRERLFSLTLVCCVVDGFSGLSDMELPAMITMEMLDCAS